jgi:transcriptional regulator with XRE-family HTH domain
MSPEIRLFGSAVRARRTALKVSQGVVASLAGIRRERVSFIESGLVPNAAEMAAIARALGCSSRPRRPARRSRRSSRSNASQRVRGVPDARLAPRPSPWHPLARPSHGRAEG